MATATGRVKSLLARARGRLAGCLRHRPYLVSDGAGWVIDAEAARIAEEVNRQFGLGCRVVCGRYPLQHLFRQVVHFGSLPVFTGLHSRVHGSNRLVVTCYHGDRADPAFAQPLGILLGELHRVDRIVVSCRLMAERLAAWQVAPEKVALIPLGVDLAVFHPPSRHERQAARQRLGIGPEQIVIGSFQKDGVGWGDGLKPKWIKGPDLLVQVLHLVHRQLPILALLAGPARAYVRAGLERLGVPYRHVLPGVPSDVASCYHALDVYLITSREEGGPKAVVEAMASGVPLVSTRVGMAADLIDHGNSGLLCDREDAEGLAARVLQLAADAQLRARLSAGGYQTAQACSYRLVARQFYQHVYAPLLKAVG